MTGDEPRLPLRHGSFLWGPWRARLGLSLRDLQELTGINRATLSLAERGKIQVPAAMFDKVTAALERAQSASPPPATLVE